MQEKMNLCWHSRACPGKLGPSRWETITVMCSMSLLLSQEISATVLPFKSQAQSDQQVGDKRAAQFGLNDRLEIQESPVQDNDPPVSLNLPNLILDKLQSVQKSFGLDGTSTSENIEPKLQSNRRHHLRQHKRNGAELISVPNTLSSSASRTLELSADSFVPPGYDKLMPPKENGKPTTVRFHVWVLGLDSINEGSMTYVADIFMSQSWKDNRLVIPENITFNINSSSDPRGPYRLLPLTLIDKIWRPDSFFKNAKEVTFQEMTIPNHYIWLYSDRTILYMVKLSLLLSCAMKFQAYPHDTQNCTLKIESLSYTTDDLVFDWEESEPLVVEKHIELPQHDLIKQKIDYCTTDYSSGTFACVQVLFTIKRRLGYYIFHTYIPTCLIVIMSWISFWIKPEAVPARVTLCVTSLLTLSTQHAQSQKSLPPVSYIKAIDIFMSSCTVFVFASLMEYALVNILMSDEWLNAINIPLPDNSSLETSVLVDDDPCMEQSSTTCHKHRSNKQNIRADHRHERSRFRDNCCHDSLASMSNYDEEENGEKDETLAELETICKLRSKKISQHLPNHVKKDNLTSSLTDVSKFASANKQCKHSNVRRQNSWSIIRLLSQDRSLHTQTSKLGTETFHPLPVSPRPATLIVDSPACQHGPNDSSGLKHRCSKTKMLNSQVKQGSSKKKAKQLAQQAQLQQMKNMNDMLGGTCGPSMALAGSYQRLHRRAYVVDRISRWIFPLSFVVLNIFYWAYYLDLLQSLKNFFNATLRFW